MRMMAEPGASRRADGAKKVKSVLLEKSEEGACGVGFVTRLKLTRDNRASLQTRATQQTQKVRSTASTYQSTVTMAEQNK